MFVFYKNTNVNKTNGLHVRRGTCDEIYLKNKWICFPWGNTLISYYKVMYNLKSGLVCKFFLK